MNSPHQLDTPDPRTREALCRTDPDAWADPPQGNTLHAHQARIQAARVCTICPLLDACTTYSLTNHQTGQILAGRWKPGPKAHPRTITECCEGHPLTGDNMVVKSGRLRCRTCGRKAG